MEEAGIRANDVLHDPDGTWACDDQSGESLRPELVREARKEEMKYFRDMKVYVKVATRSVGQPREKLPLEFGGSTLTREMSPTQTTGAGWSQRSLKLKKDLNGMRPRPRANASK